MLKLLVATRKNKRRPSESIFLPEKYDFFENLPSTWLGPPIASNLRELSLYCPEYFGWAPKLDLRKITSGSAHASAFPNLRVLALGRYVFSHEWQVEWIASLGKENGRGGLEELYLDACPIMWRARTLKPLDNTTQMLDGLELDNHG